MEINTTSTDVKNLIIDSLKNGNSLSVVRLGDGEMIIANNVQEKIKIFSKKQIGRLMTDEEIKKTKNNLYNSVLHSDIIGLPTKSHVKKHELWASIEDYYNKIFNINRVFGLSSKIDNKKYCSIDLHLDLLKSGELFEIFNNVESIVIVSSRDIGDRLKNKFNNIKSIEYYNIPGEQCYETEKNEHINIFNEIDIINKKLTSKNRKHELLIYGTGPFGKQLGYSFANSGGVAIDLGSVFDFLIGKITRGHGKGPESYTKPYI